MLNLTFDTYSQVKNHLLVSIVENVSLPDPITRTTKNVMLNKDNNISDVPMTTVSFKLHR